MSKQPKQKYEMIDLLHGKALYDACYERQVSYSYLMEEMRELLKLAAKVVVFDNYDAQQEAIDELEEFLR